MDSIKARLGGRPPWCALASAFGRCLPHTQQPESFVLFGRDHREDIWPVWTLYKEILLECPTGPGFAVEFIRFSHSPTERNDPMKVSLIAFITALLLTMAAL